MSFNEGVVVGTVVFIAMILVGGFFNQNIPTWLSWLKPLSFITYAYENAVLMEFTNIKSHR